MNKIITKVVTISSILLIGTFNLTACNQDSASEKSTQESSTVVTPAPPSPWQKLELLQSLNTDSTPIVSITISPDGKTIAASSFSGVVKIWYLESGELILEEKLDTEIRSIRFSPDGKIVALGDAERNVNLYDFATRELLRTLEGHQAVVESLDFSPDGQTLVSGSWDQTIKLWSVETGQLLQTLEGNQDMVTSVAFSPDGKFIAE